MIEQLWNYIKIGFKLKIYVFAIVFFGISFCGIAPTNFLKSLCLLITLPFIPVMACITTIDSINKVRDIVLMQLKRGLDIPVPDEIQRLADSMGVKIKKVKMVQGVMNAGVSPTGKVVIGEPILHSLDKNEFQSVFAHEFSHVKRKHHLKRLLVFSSLIIAGFIVFSNVPSLLQAYAIIAFLSIAIIPFNWRFEFEADDDGKKYVGATHMASALRKLIGDRNPKEASETHPPINLRIQRILG